MKAILFCTVLMVIGFGSTAAPAQCNSRYDSAMKCSYYDEGFRDGADDASSYLSNDYRRHRDKFNNTYESYYRNGYAEGFRNSGSQNNGGGSARWTDSQRNAYDAGFDIGRSDRRRSTQARVPESNNRYDADIGLYFEQGYNDGFGGRGKRYDFPMTGTGGWNGNGGWNGSGNGGWNGGGSASGTATWSGRVDDKANIIIRGGNIRTEDVSGTGVQTRSQNMGGTLPSRPTTVGVNKRSGRGSVYVLQQPARNNGYTAIIQISDTKGGAGDYQVDINWSGNGMGNGGWNNGNSGGWTGNNSGWSGQNEVYQSGRVTWRGRVDQKANIIINGSNVQSQDDAGTGLSDVRFDLNGYLAHRSGNVTVRKRNGRGSVNVLQQPADWNDFTAIIQVFDPGSGADDYEVEISW